LLENDDFKRNLDEDNVPRKRLKKNHEEGSTRGEGGSKDLCLLTDVSTNMKESTRVTKYANTDKRYHSKDSPDLGMFI
jgi:hypothetical protein